ncbi:hypothetical protein [Clostridium sp.]|uniref:hypothetical protein n=1 Tax=Clostridium sp. TaxID=1506 RepID=UPI0035A02F0A
MDYIQIILVGLIHHTFRYNGTNFIVQGKGGGGSATAGDLLLGKTATVDTGQITGLLDLSNLVANNIRKDVIINNVTGTLIPVELKAGNVVLLDQAAGAYLTTSYPTLIPVSITCKANYTGSIRISFDLSASSNGVTATGVIYKNDELAGTIRSTTSIYSTTYTEDFQCAVGDRFYLCMECNNQNYAARCSNIKFMGDINNLVTATI